MPPDRYHTSQRTVAEHGATPSFFCCPAACGPRMIFCDEPYDDLMDHDSEERPLLHRDRAFVRERKAYWSVSSAAMHR